MKRSLFMLGVAVAALSSCSQSEILEVAEGRAIGFSSFVNNNTRAVTEIQTGLLESSQFNVFGNYGDGSNWEGKAYQNEPGSNKYYWKESNTYRFGAYADGVTGRIENAKFDPSTKTLSFPQYSPNDAKDLIACVSQDVKVENVQEQRPVELNFKHMLSQVAFEFTTDAADIYELKISNVEITGAISKTSGSISVENGIVWDTNGAKYDEYVYESFTDGIDIADGKLQPARTSSQTKLVIPQVLGENVQVLFKATLKDGNNNGEELKEQNFRAKLTFTKSDAQGSSDPDSGKWTAGYRYKYTTKITADMIDGDLKDKDIEFTATVSDWENAEMGDSGSLKPSQSGN